MPRFRCLAGVAFVDDKEYHEGEIVSTDKELDRLFANKFRRIGGPTKVPQDHSDDFDKSNGGHVMDKPNKLSKDKAKQTAKGPGPGQTEEEFIDMSHPSRVKGKGKNRRMKTQDEFDEEGTPEEELEDEAAADEDTETEETSEDEEVAAESEGEEEETASEEDGEEEEKPKKKSLKEKKAKKHTKK